MRAAGDLAFFQLPMLAIDGLQIVQSQSINRYLARKCNLYGANAAEAVQCDMIADGIVDFQPGWLYFPFQAESKFEEKTDPDDKFFKEKSNPAIAKYAPRLEAIVAKNAGVFSVGSQLTYAG